MSHDHHPITGTYAQYIQNDAAVISQVCLCYCALPFSRACQILWNASLYEMLPKAVCLQWNNCIVHLAPEIWAFSCILSELNGAVMVLCTWRSYVFFFFFFVHVYLKTNLNHTSLFLFIMRELSFWLESVMISMSRITDTEPPVLRGCVLF